MPGWRALLEPLLAGRQGCRHRLNIGTPPQHDLRDLLDAIPLRHPGGHSLAFPPAWPPALEHGLCLLRERGTRCIFGQLDALLRRRVREDAGRSLEPTDFVIDAPSVENSTNVPVRKQGVDGGKKIVGRERKPSIIIDTAGRLYSSPLPASRTPLLATPPQPHRRRPPRPSQVWLTATTANTLSTTPLASAPTSKSCAAPRAPRAPRWVIKRTTGSCATAARPATTKPSPPAPSAMVRTR